MLIDYHPELEQANYHEILALCKVIRNKNRVIVEGVAMVKKHNKPNSNNPKGGITEKESSIHISNVSLTTKDGETTRVGYRIEDDKKVRYSVKNNEII